MINHISLTLGNYSLCNNSKGYAYVSASQTGPQRLKALLWGNVTLPRFVPLLFISQVSLRTCSEELLLMF
ncbi:hypothetical protein AAG906_025271 [Vitis piasezkii]